MAGVKLVSKQDSFRKWREALSPWRFRLTVIMGEKTATSGLQVTPLRGGKLLLLEDNPPD